MKKIDLAVAIALFCILAVAIHISSGVLTWLFVTSMIGHLVVTISKVGKDGNNTSK